MQAPNVFYAALERVTCTGRSPSWLHSWGLLTLVEPALGNDSLLQRRSKDKLLAINL